MPKVFPSALALLSALPLRASPLLLVSGSLHSHRPWLQVATYWKEPGYLMMSLMATNYFRNYVLGHDFCC